jgi:5-methylcytosine-specific restriction endonuclease McrA
MRDFDPVKATLGTLCRNGHDYDGTGQSLRRLKERRGVVVPADCLQCQREDRKRRYASDPEQAKASAKQWYAQNRERVADTFRSYYREHRQKLLEYQTRYREENADLVKTRRSVYYLREREQIRAKSRAWYVLNKLRAKESRAAWRLRNLVKVRAWNRWYSATSRGQERARRAATKYRMHKVTQHGSVTVAYKEAMLAALGGRCPHCGVVLTVSGRLSPSSLTWDHVVPLSHNGRDDNGNLLPLCHSCNASKGDRTPEQWLGRPVTCVADLFEDLKHAQ